jgi:hypothetical protein
VDAQRHGRVERLEDPHGFFGIDVVGLHEVARLVGADRDDREAEGAVPRRFPHPAAVAEAGSPA